MKRNWWFLIPLVIVAIPITLSSLPQEDYATRRAREVDACLESRALRAETGEYVADCLMSRYGWEPAQAEAEQFIWETNVMLGR